MNLPDPETHDIWAQKGFEAVINGRAVSGPTVDWISSRYPSTEVGLVTELSKRGTSAETLQPSSGFSAAPHYRGSAFPLISGPESATEISDAGSVTPTTGIMGLWTWRMDAAAQSDSKDDQSGFDGGGALGFGKQPDGRFGGHAYVFLPAQGAADVMKATILELRNFNTVQTGGNTEVTFELGGDGGQPVTRSVARLSQDGQILTGESSVALSPGGVAYYVHLDSSSNSVAVAVASGAVCASSLPIGRRRAHIL